MSDLNKINTDDRAEIRKQLLQAQKDLDDMILTCETELGGTRLYTQDEETMKEVLTETREIARKVGQLIGKIDASPIQIRQHIVADGETLQKIAAEELGDAKYWTLLAEANDIMDPTALTTGTVLELPYVATI